MNTSILLCISIGLAVVNGRVAPPSKSAENKDKRGALSGSYGSPSSLSHGGSSSSYESSPSYSVPSHSYGIPNSHSQSETGSGYSDSSYSSPSYASSDYSSSSDSGFKPIKSPAIEHSSSSIGYSQQPAISAPYSHGLSVGVLPSPSLDYTSLSYGSFGGLSSLGGHTYGGFGNAYPYSGLGLGAAPHYPRLGPVSFGAISAPYGGIPFHAGIQDYSSLTAAPIAPISLMPAYSSASLYSPPISNFHSFPSSYAPSQYSSPSYSPNAFSGSSLSLYSNNKPYSSSYATSSDYTSSPSKYSSSGSSGYSSGYSPSSYSSHPTSSSYTAPPYSRYPSVNRDSYSGSSSYKGSPAKDYNF